MHQVDQTLAQRRYKELELAVLFSLRAIVIDAQTNRSDLLTRSPCQGSLLLVMEYHYSSSKE